MAAITREELDRMFTEKVKAGLQEGLDEKLQPVLKGFTDRLDSLEKTAPQKFHTSSGMIDDGEVQEVGHELYRLPGGSVVNTGGMWPKAGKGFRKTSGVFESLGDEAKEFFMNMRKSLKVLNNFKVATKGWDSEAEEKALAMDAVMSSQVDAHGGSFVPEDIRYTLLQFAPPGTIVWPRAQVHPMAGPSILWPKLKQDITTAGAEEFFGNVIMTWTEEGGEKTDTMAEFGQLALTAHELSAYTELTDVLIEDSAINIGNLLVQLFQGVYWHFTDRSFLRGMGNVQPLGILNDPKIRVQKRVEANRLRFEDLLNMDGKLPPMFDANAVWMMAKPTFNNLRKQKDDNGRPVIDLGQGYNDFGEGVAGYILGKPVVMGDYKVNALGTRGDVVLGDWKHYFIGEREGVKMEMSRHYVFKHNRTAFRAASRLGGIPEEPNAFVILSDEVDTDES